MKNKKLLTGITTILMLATFSVTALADSPYSSAVEAVAGVTGKTVEEVIAERQNGDTYGMIADEEGMLDEFKQVILDMKKDMLDAQIYNGTLTESQADEILTDIETRQGICDGTGIGQSGKCSMRLNGSGGRGMGRGNGLRDGSCLYN